MSARTVIAIGWARSGSTAFRQNFLNRHAGIATAPRGQAEADGPGAVILDGLKRMDDADFALNAPEFRRNWASFAEHCGRPVACLTDEELSIGLFGTGVSPIAIARRCGTLFPDARVFAVVRDQVDAIRSFYTLVERTGLTGNLSLSDWVRHYFLKPDDGGFAFLFDYARTLEAYREGRAENAVTAIAYDRFKARPMAAYADAAHALGIDEAPCADFPTDVVNASPQRERACEPDVAAAIRALYATSNQRLTEAFGVDFNEDFKLKDEA